MDHTHHQPESSPEARPKGSKTPLGQKVAIYGAMAVLLFYLLTEHRAHFFGALPYLLLLACPLMHIFMHGNHGGHSHDNKRDKQ